MAPKPCAHRAGFKAYRRGPAPSYPFLPAGLACPTCGRYFPPEEPVVKQDEHSDFMLCPPERGCKRGACGEQEGGAK
jgi:hypothetical protein